MIVFNGLQLIWLAVLLSCLIIYGLIVSFEKFNAWRKTGFCKHQFKLHDTNSSGQKHWYKCEKCKNKRLM